MARKKKENAQIEGDVVISVPKSLMSYRDMNLSGSDFTGSVFENADFTNTVAQGANFTDCTFKDCIFDNTDFRWSIGLEKGLNVRYE